MIILEGIYKVSNQEFNCGNCSALVSEKLGFIEGWTCTTTSRSTDESEKVTVMDAIVKLFNPNLQTTPELIIDDGLKLCSRCVERLRDLYLYYNLFVQLNTLNSDISKLIAFGQSTKDFVPFTLSSTELTKCQPSGAENSEELSNVQESLPTQIDTFDPIEFKIEDEDSVSSTSEEADADDNDNSDCESPSSREEIIKTDTQSSIIRRSSRLSVRKRFSEGSSLESSNESSKTPKKKIIKRNPGKNILSKKSHSCSMCDRRFRVPILLKIHLKKLHSVDTGVEASLTYQNGNRSKLLQCPHCPKKFVKAELRRHMNSVHLKLRPYKCDTCDSIFATPSSLKKHKRRIHLNPKEKSNGFTSKEGLKDHTKNHKRPVHLKPKEKSALCTLCGKAFNSKGNLREHMKRHLPRNQDHKCDLCSKVFLGARFLARHKLTHTDERNHLCSTCGKGYKTREHLQTHEKYHISMAERKIKCPHCERGFPNKRSLKDHLISKAHGMSLEEARRVTGWESKKVEIVESVENLSC